MANKFTSEMLDKLNNLYNLKENAYDVENLLLNLNSHVSENEKNYFVAAKYKDDVLNRVINLEIVSPELRERLINCCKSYAKEIEDKLSSVEIIGIE